MKRRRLRPLALVAALLAAGALVAAYATLAPVSIGGKTMYAFTYGISMEPKLHKGDLVVVRKAASFQVGDVALYENRDLQRKVLHRILRVDGDRYPMKGDNNAFVDTFEPARADMLGTLWFTVPGVGKAGDWLAEPAHAAILTGAIAFLSLLGTGLKAERHHRRRRGQAQKGVSAAAQARSRTASPGGLVPGQAVQAAGGVLAVVALLCGLLAAVAYTRSTTRLGDGPAVYAQHGSFAYSAQVPAGGAVYEDGKLTTGQPAYVQGCAR